MPETDMNVNRPIHPLPSLLPAACLQSRQVVQGGNFSAEKLKK